MLCEAEKKSKFHGIENFLFFLKLALKKKYLKSSLVTSQVQGRKCCNVLLVFKEQDSMTNAYKLEMLSARLSSNWSHRHPKCGQLTTSWEMKPPWLLHAGSRALQVIPPRQGPWFAALYSSSVTPGNWGHWEVQVTCFKSHKSQERVKKRSNVPLTLNLPFHPLI